MKKVLSGADDQPIADEPNDNLKLTIYESRPMSSLNKKEFMSPDSSKKKFEEDPMIKLAK